MERQGQTTSTTWTGVNRLAWHPFNGQILGIYRDGQIFKWGPMDDSHEGVMQEMDATPSEITISGVGSIFATSDVKGAVKMYNFSQMVLIYKFTSDDIITSIAFSSDIQRFFDLRGRYCNVWEPNCLIRLSDSGLDMSEADSRSVTSSEWERKGSIMSDRDDILSTSISFSTSEAHADSCPAIILVETCVRNQQLVAYAKDYATIEVYDMMHEERHVIVRSSFGMGVGQLVLSRDGDFIAYSLVNGRIAIKSLDLRSSSGKIVTKVALAEKKSIGREVIRQILLEDKSERIFISGSAKIQVLDVASGSVLAERTVYPHPKQQHGAWEIHPSDANILLQFTADQVATFSWAILESACTLPIYRSQRSPDDGPAPLIAVETLLPSYYPQTQLVTTSSEESNMRALAFLVLDMSALLDQQEEGTNPKGSISAVAILPQTATHIKQSVGLLPDGRLVFLDENLWVCTTQLRSASGSLGGTDNNNLMRHFFVPHDWLNSAGMMLCRVQSDGTFLYPSKGEMAIIKSDIGTAWRK
ncbi:uncharacterized protein BCR38DRAFT_479444 [Pseudomassariella vexata]|uniref:WD40-repeat-containing domain protein n=1 Tax=Pseudomassariella vexata TaxID=1141098 RepID=A0A1Y2EH58_9PEZI|nr:uncharacterized protein BCR38DRAFT_479444 [Pseudomassariella vexata]ORY70910.1 hypothetical protein BCR38DRAFT_479444 [Pseudomassariella vexata]